MSNNIVDKNVSDKVVWENGVTHDNDFTPTMSQPQSEFHSQSQKMFCYNCNNVIPADSKCCPYCQIELYVTCPKCGAKYSSQYPACNQCGTNRLEYIETQKREKERIEARKREERLRQEKLELERKEQERKEALERQEREAHWRQECAIAERKKEQIINTKEYQSTYSALKESLESFRRKHIMTIVLTIAFAALYMIVYKSLGRGEPEGALAIIHCFIIPLGLTLGIVLPIYSLTNTEKREQHIIKYISTHNYDYDKDMLNYVLKEMRNTFYEYTYDVLDELSDWCIEAYKKGLSSL